ncbi:MAG: polyhydroxyalkanoate synthesis regulator DNA-binding domain-containing protein [Bradymonadaceae bacterium]
MKTIKKYSNRRLYDTDRSQYITLEELAETIRAGHDVRVIDAKTEADLTQTTLAQIVVESQGATRWLPTPLLMQMIRMGDDALAEFMSHYMTWALEVYFHVKEGMLRQQSFNPFSNLLNPQAGISRLFSMAPWLGGGNSFVAGSERSKPVPEPEAEDELAILRREMEELKAHVKEMQPEDGKLSKTKKKKA